MAFNFNKLTVKAQEILQTALEIGQNYNNQVIEPEHILASLVQESGNIADTIIQKTGGNLNRLKLKVNELLESLPKVSGAGIGSQAMSSETAKLFDAAAVEARNLKDEYVSTEHILLALANSDGKAGRLLKENGISHDEILTALKDVRGTQRVTTQNPEDTYQALEKYGRDLNELAKAGKLDPVIGRDEEIRRAMQVLSRRTKNNPLLIGEPGVGKTAIAEGLVIKIANGDIPPKLADRELYLLDLTALVAGTQFRGQFEGRIKGLIDEVKKAGNIILFIDEVHNLVGTGDAEGSMNAANILKPAFITFQICKLLVNILTICLHHLFFLLL